MAYLFKKKSNHSIIYIIIGMVIFLVVIVFVTVFIKNFKDDANKNNDIMLEIKTSYQQLEMDISSYNEIRTDLLVQLENYYTENLVTDHQRFIDYLTQEEDIIIGIKNHIDLIEENCQDRIFLDSEVNTICSVSLEYYEKVVNIFIKDQNQINSIIKNYNETEGQSLELYRAKQFKDYIDYNQDGVYLERED